jgi:AraC family transcriptional regulator, regulatory protein of adaptative response / methylated-DNA-[protein]-cysteine methyltransferase
MLTTEQTLQLDHDDCYAAVVARDSRYDGRFVTAVRTTHIYCRPSCPARTPHRKNVTFYATPAEAESAGFRACKRCQPDQQAFEAQVAADACRYIEEHLSERLTLDDLGAAVNLSPQHFQRVFKRATGISPKQYIEARRTEALKIRLKAGEQVTTALYDAGYSSSSRVYERADGNLGMTPAAYRKGGQGMRMHFTITACSLGYMLVAATERGISVVRLDDAPDTLEAGLYSDYPAADIQPDDGQLATWVEAILDYLSGDEPHLELPLDIRATAFQWRVWQTLKTIPYGETRSYSEVAAALGNPKAVRAVAKACADNPTALVIPCHRVVGKDGSLAGYRWGLARKATLLEQEKEKLVAVGD